MSLSKDFQESLKYLLLLIPGFLVLQAILILMHEFTHSTVAWLLGEMKSPLGIVWGNPVMMTGWDEGVGYRKLFAQGKLHAAAIIGVSPLIAHFSLSILGVLTIAKGWFQNKKWLFHAVFWYTVANLMELVAYIPMRGFAFTGDTGNFNRGMELSPWYLFVLGSLAIVLILRLLFLKALPRLYETLNPENRVIQWMILVFSAFILFFWGSGLRVMFYIYPDPQWVLGLLGFPAFILVLYLFRPVGIVGQRQSMGL